MCGGEVVLLESTALKGSADDGYEFLGIRNQNAASKRSKPEGNRQALNF